MTELRTRMVRDMALRGFSPRTHKSYIAYLLHLVQDRKLAWASCRLAVNAFRFLYHVTLERDRTDFRVPAPKVPQKLTEASPPARHHLRRRPARQRGRRPQGLRHRSRAAEHPRGAGERRQGSLRPPRRSLAR